MVTQKNRYLYYGWIILGICLSLIIISYGIRFSYGIFLTSLEQDFNSNRTLVSAVFSVHMLLGSLFAIIAGWTVDRYGPKGIFVTMGVMTCLGMLATSQVHQFWHLFISYSLLMSIGIGPAFVVATSVATKWFEKKRGLAIAIVSSGTGLGSIIIAPLAAYLIETSGWRFSSAILGLIALIVLVPLAFFLKKTGEEATSSASERGRASVEYKSAAASTDVISEFSIRKTIFSRNFIFLLFLWIFYSFGLFIIVTHLVPYAIDLHITPLRAASLISVMGFVNIPGRLLAGVVSDRFGRKPVAVINAFLMVVAMLLLLFSSNLLMLYIFVAIYGFSYGGFGTVVVAMVGDIFGARNMGTIMGFTEVGWVIGAALGPALAGYFYDIAQTYHSAFIVQVIAAFIVLLLIISMRIPGTKKQTGSTI